MKTTQKTAAENVLEVIDAGLVVDVSQNLQDMDSVAAAAHKTLRLIDPTLRCMAVDSDSGKLLCFHSYSPQLSLLDQKEHLRLSAETVLGLRKPTSKGAKKIERGSDDFLDALVVGEGEDQIEHFVKLGGVKVKGKKKTETKVPRPPKPQEIEGAVIGISIMRGCIEVRADYADVALHIDLSDRNSDEAERLLSLFKMSMQVKVRYIGTKRSGTVTLEELELTLEEAGVSVTR